MRGLTSKALKPYAGKLVISPDAPPTTIRRAAGVSQGEPHQGREYHVIKGPPWPFHLVAMLAKDDKQVTLVVTDIDPKLAVRSSRSRCPRGAAS